jgi:hypothetical protein
MFAINPQDSNTTILFRCTSKQGQQVKKKNNSSVSLQRLYWALDWKDNKDET